MNTRTRTQLLALFAAGTVMFAAGCDQRNSSTPNTSGTATPPASSTTSKASTAGDKMAASTQKAGDKLDDAAITTKVKTALMAEPGLRSLEINVDTRDNVVTLNGTVDSQEKKQRAMQIAQGVEGVKSVSDNLVVKSS
jgi:hyperosmotically inducible protein